MTDLLLDSDHDLAWVDGDLVAVTGYQETEQAILQALRTGLGEWAFDTAAGVAYRGGWRVKPLANAVIDADVRRVILGVRGVSRIIKVDIVPDFASRHVTVSVEVMTTYGEAARAELLL
jgi:hypothetical protein